MKFCKESLHDLVQVLKRRSCEDPGGVLCQRYLMILYRPLTEDLAETFWRCLCESSSGMLLGDSNINFL